MFELSVCRIEGRLLKAIHEELSNVERLEKDPGGCPAQARITLVEVQIAADTLPTWVDQAIVSEWFATRK